MFGFGSVNRDFRETGPNLLQPFKSMLESSSQRISRREANKVFYWIEDSSKTSNNQRLRSAGDNETLFLHRCASRNFHMIDSQNTRDHITSDRGSKRERLNCVICIPFIIS